MSQQTLIQRQDAALAKMAEPRTSERRARRMQCRVVHAYCERSLKLGYTDEQVNLQARDLWDMHKLNENAES